MADRLTGLRTRPANRPLSALRSASGMVTWPLLVTVAVHQLPCFTYDAVHYCRPNQAAHHGRSTEAEIRDILERAAKPEGRVKLGSFLAAIAREAGGLTDEEHALFESVRIKSEARAGSFE
jgi:plasmid stability protein